MMTGPTVQPACPKYLYNKLSCEFPCNTRLVSEANSHNNQGKAMSQSQLFTQNFVL